MSVKLPPPARWLLRLLVPDDWRDSVEGDLAEERAKRQARGQPAGPLWAIVSAARVAIGLAVERRKEIAARNRVAMRRMTLDGVIADFRLAARALRAQPGYAVTTALTLALGIGANATVFNLANWLLLRPVPGVVGQDRLVAIGFGSADSVRIGV